MLSEPTESLRLLRCRARCRIALQHPYAPHTHATADPANTHPASIDTIDRSIGIAYHSWYV